MLSIPIVGPLLSGYGLMKRQDLNPQAVDLHELESP